MIAPRKKLWTSPIEVVNSALEIMEITEDDVVIDMGAGEGNFIISCAQTTKAKKIIGIEIEENRFEIAKENMKKILNQAELSRCQLLLGNALELDVPDATCFYMYLNDRGFKVVLPFLLALKKKIRVVSYMTSLKGDHSCVKLLKVVKVTTSKHTGAEWPIHYYEINGGLI